MESMFIGPTNSRRRFLDRVVYNFHTSHAKHLTKYDYYMKERIKTLSQNRGQLQSSWLSTIENKMTEEAMFVEKARKETINHMQEAIDNLATNFPKAKLTLSQLSEQQTQWSNFAEDYLKELFQNRTKDSYSGRTNFGVHKSDLNVFHNEKQTPAKLCSTGEQKALLISIILASVESILKHTDCTPILLLDELFVHLDDDRKKQLTKYITSTKLQTFVTATDIVGIENMALESNIIKL